LSPIGISLPQQKPAFRDAWWRGQRCLVVTDGFYEWKKLDAKGKLKQPYAIAVTDNDAQMVMAGLWAKWKSPTSGEEVLSCTILTCGPNKVMGELHDRMPVILAEIDWPKWLGEEPASEQDLLALLKPCPDEALTTGIKLEIVYGAAVTIDSAAPNAASAFVKFMAAPENRPVWKEGGFEPPTN
jgi:putative SOS response-associated peptidase YedK